MDVRDVNGQVAILSQSILVGFCILFLLNETNFYETKHLNCMHTLSNKLQLNMSNFMQKHHK